jgi:adenylate kinase family enzyme
MPMLASTDPLPHPMRRVLVAGASGAGKTTLARQVEAALAVPHTEIDALFHGPGWVPRASFLDDVGELLAQPSWVTEWQYGAARPALTAEADTMLWLDLPRWLVMCRVVRRTVRRRLRREELWNGNLEPPFAAFFTDQDHIVRWAWRTHAGNRQRVLEAAAGRPDLAVVRLRSPAEVRAWVRRLGRGEP